MMTIQQLNRQELRYVGFVEGLVLMLNQVGSEPTGGGLIFRRL